MVENNRLDCKFKLSYIFVVLSYFKIKVNVKLSYEKDSVINGIPFYRVNLKSLDKMKGVVEHGTTANLTRCTHSNRKNTFRKVALRKMKYFEMMEMHSVSSSEIVCSVYSKIDSVSFSGVWT